MHLISSYYRGRNILFLGPVKALRPLPLSTWTTVPFLSVCPFRGPVFWGILRCPDTFRKGAASRCGRDLMPHGAHLEAPRSAGLDYRYPLGLPCRSEGSVPLPQRSGIPRAQDIPRRICRRMGPLYRKLSYFSENKLLRIPVKARNAWRRQETPPSQSGPHFFVCGKKTLLELPSS